MFGSSPDINTRNTHVSNSDKTYIVTETQLYNVFLQWEEERRNGHCESYETIDKMTVEETVEDLTLTFCEKISCLQEKEKMMENVFST